MQDMFQLIWRAELTYLDKLKACPTFQFQPNQIQCCALSGHLGALGWGRLQPSPEVPPDFSPPAAGFI